MIKIINIKKKSPADRQGLLAGDEIISINGMEVRDYLDY
ncbi:MAG TPA: PDZ domain-containing protein, partial [Spirochaetota bacterium]|nr:PDZ domain-containing protein [Spirochaetota bacterium]